MELLKNLKHFKFWKYFYWKHDNATLRVQVTLQNEKNIRNVLKFKVEADLFLT